MAQPEKRFFFLRDNFKNLRRHSFRRVGDVLRIANDNRSHNNMIFRHSDLI